MKKLILMTTLLVAGASIPFAQDSMDNDYNNSDSGYSYGNHRGGNRRGNHMSGDYGDRRHGSRRGNHMSGDYGDRRHGSRRGHMKGGDYCGRGASYYSQMPVEVQQQIQAIEQKYETQRLAIDQKYDTHNVAFRAQYDELYNSISDEDMISMNNATLTPEQAKFLLQMDELDAQRNQVREERRNEIRTLENQASDAIDSVTQKWLSSIK